MEARDIYHVLKSIVEPIHAHDDQIVAIAKWIEAEFEYKPQKQTNGVNTEQKALILDSVMPCLFCVENYTDNDVKLLTKGKKYPLLYKHKDLYAILDDTGDMEVFSEVFFK